MNEKVPSFNLLEERLKQSFLPKILNAPATYAGVIFVMIIRNQEPDNEMFYDLTNILVQQLQLTQLEKDELKAIYLECNLDDTKII
jgi:hypothetical protein